MLLKMRKGIGIWPFKSSSLIQLWKNRFWPSEPHYPVPSIAPGSELTHMGCTELDLCIWPRTCAAYSICFRIPVMHSTHHRTVLAIASPQSVHDSQCPLQLVCNLCCMWCLQVQITGQIRVLQSETKLLKPSRISKCQIPETKLRRVKSQRTKSMGFRDAYHSRPTGRTVG